MTTYLPSYCLHSFGDFGNLFFLLVEITAKEAESILGITSAVVDHKIKHLSGKNTLNFYLQLVFHSSDTVGEREIF